MLDLNAYESLGVVFVASLTQRCIMLKLVAEEGKTITRFSPSVLCTTAAPLKDCMVWAGKHGRLFTALNKNI
jgi:hypothetical protein